MRFVNISEAADLIKGHYLLSKVIQDAGVALKKQGREWVGLCPFRDEKTPSFSVNDDKGLYYCRGCNATGDVIAFISETQGISPGQAIKKLAEPMGVRLANPNQGAQTSSGSPNQKPGRLSLDQITELHDRVAHIAHRYLVTLLAQEDSPVTRYLLQGRKLSRQVILEYGLGYLPVGVSLFKLATERSAFNPSPITATETQWRVWAVEAGLINDRFEQSMFQGRLLFPVTNAQGRCVAFSARVIPGAEHGVPMVDRKYINTPETHIYKKSAALFGLTPPHFCVTERGISQGWQSRRGQGALYPVEGVTDVLRLAERGLFSCAGLGTALTSDHISLMLRHSKTICLIMDGDTAGIRAAERALLTAFPGLTAGHAIEARTLPPSDDPDTYFSDPTQDAAALIASLPRLLPEDIWLHVVAGTPNLPLSLADRIRIDQAFADASLTPQDPLWKIALMRAVADRTGYLPNAPDHLAPQANCIDTESRLLADDPTQLWLIRVARAPSILNALSAISDSWWAKEVSRGLLRAPFEVYPVLRTLIQAYRLIQGASLDAYSDWPTFAGLLIDRGVPSTLVMAWHHIVTETAPGNTNASYHAEVFAPDLWSYELSEMAQSTHRMMEQARDQALNRPVATSTARSTE